MDQQTMTWHPDVVASLPQQAAAVLPPLADVSSALPSLSPAYQRRWPRLARARLVLAIGDGAAASLGSACTLATRRIAVTIGTSAGARIVLPVSAHASPRSCSAARGETMVDLGTVHGGADSEIVRQIDGCVGVEALMAAKGACTRVMEDPTAPRPTMEADRLHRAATCGHDLSSTGLWKYVIDTHHRLIGGALTDGGCLIDWLRALLHISASDWPALVRSPIRRTRDIKGRR